MWSKKPSVTVCYQGLWKINMHVSKCISLATKLLPLSWWVCICHTFIDRCQQVWAADKFCFVVISSFILAESTLNNLFREPNVFIAGSLISWFTYWCWANGTLETSFCDLKTMQKRFIVYLASVIQRFSFQKVSRTLYCLIQYNINVVKIKEAL